MSRKIKTPVKDYDKVNLSNVIKLLMCVNSDYLNSAWALELGLEKTSEHIDVGLTFARI